MASSFEDLPLLVLESVCEYLTTIDLRRRSLFALSLTSKRCCDVTSRERFCRIHIAIQNGDQLVRTLSQWNDILKLGERTRYPFIREVKISGSMELKGKGSYQYTKEHDIDIYDNCSDDESTGIRAVGQGYVDPLPTPEKIDLVDQLWQPLGDFLTRCHGLKRIIWDSTNQVPRGFLTMLHKNLPNTHLYVNFFDLRSLHQRADQLHDIDDNEFALVTSPNLASVQTSTTYYDDDGNVDYKEEAVMQMVHSLTPNLESMRISYPYAGGSIGLNAALARGRPPWPGFYADQRGSSSKPSNRLRSLVLKPFPLSKWRLKRWMEHTDFSKLISLALLGGSEVAALEYLSEVASNDGLKSLRNLSFDNVDIEGDDDGRVSASNDLLSHLAALERLRFEGKINDQTISVIQDHHGENLQTLHLTYQLEDEQLGRLQQACSRLQSLSMWLTRTQGDQAEVRTYRLLGSFSRLKRLALVLYCEADETGYADDYEEGQGKELQVEAIRSALINSAIDEDLARAIFQIIFASNRTIRPGVIPSFQYLKLTATCLRNGSYLEQLQEWIARSWVCERQYGDATNDEVITQEVNVQKREMYMEGLKAEIEDDFDNYGHGALLRPTWQELWPEAKGKKDWAHTWHSFPLVLGS